MSQLPAIRALLYVGVIDLEASVNLNFIREQANQHIQELSKSINVDDLGGWRLLITLVLNYGHDIGIGKRVVSYPSDNEKVWSLGIPVPDQQQVVYGLKEKHFIRTNYVRSDALFDSLDARFADYTNLQSCLTTNVLRALDTAFQRGVTVAGKRIKLNR
ncbi:hypothetical protein YDYSY3_44010 [Paenibacillus chitinolyticus]|uniref:Imm9 family immunity protein n=1 Tax=Paenibacillus chitinolyticus TaxID=79263 RepID=UPI0026E4EB6D|nr:Imm9 family immunity protein [Paenibacillus chitinolyticus]GKS13401.1 hypothetical protein YDYSY3_44010 [Paenibacillus chitinolyticus]